MSLPNKKNVFKTKRRKKAISEINRDLEWRLEGIEHAINSKNWDFLEYSADVFISFPLVLEAWHLGEVDLTFDDLPKNTQKKFVDLLKKGIEGTSYFAENIMKKSVMNRYFEEGTDLTPLITSINRATNKIYELKKKYSLE